MRILLSMLLCSMGLPGVCRVALAQGNGPLRLTLSEAIDLALKQNRSLKLAQLGVAGSQYKKEIARAAYFPHIKNESAILHVTELAGVELPAGSLAHGAATGLIPAQNLFVGQGALTTYTSGTGLLQPLTQMFKIRESNRAATADINTAKITVNQAENEIALRVRQLYYGILISQLKQRAATEEVSSSLVRNQESADAVEQGRALEVVALESRAALLDARQAALTQALQVQDLTLALDDLLGLPLNTRLELDLDTAAVSTSIPSREECIRLAEDNSPEVRAAQQAVIKARAGFGAAKDAYIPDVTAVARYSYQSGVPLLVHNFGTFGFTLSYVLFDGGRRNAEIKHARTLLSEAELNLAKTKEEVNVRVETAYDKVEQLRGMVGVVEEALKLRIEAARVSDRQFEANATLASVRAQAHAKSVSARASVVETSLGLALAQGELKRAMGMLPR